jgi:hypothetical protein
MDGLLVRQKLACCKQAQFEARWMLQFLTVTEYTPFKARGINRFSRFVCLVMPPNPDGDHERQHTRLYMSRIRLSYAHETYTYAWYL